MKTPKVKKLKIGSSWYDVEYVDELKDEKGRVLFGRIFECIRKIKINKGISSYQTMLQTLYHESRHGMMWEYVVEDIEDLVKQVTNGSYAFIIDNPEFIKEILRNAKGEKC